MNFKTKLMCSGVALMALAACGGGSGSSGSVQISNSEEALRLFADVDGDGSPDGDLADLLDNGDVVFARQAAEATWRQNYGEGTTYENVDGEVSFELVGNDLEVTMGLPGEDAVTRVVPDAVNLDSRSYVFENGNEYFEIFLLGSDDTFAEFLAGGLGYGKTVAIFYDEFSDDFGFNSRVAVGAETQDAAIAAASDELTYLGYGEMSIREDGESFSSYNGVINGDLTMTADFGSGTISGEMDNISFRERRDRVEGVWTTETTTNVDGSILLDETNFNLNGFAGTTSVDSVLAAEEGAAGLAGTIGGSLEYSGVFFGPEAEEVGGVFEGGTTVSDEGGTVDYTVIGDWYGNSN